MLRQGSLWLRNASTPWKAPITHLKANHVLTVSPRIFRYWPLPSAILSRWLSSDSALFKQTQFPPRPMWLIKEEDIDEVFIKGGSGPGGQKINKTNSKVQLKHKPTGLVVTCQQTRSQDRNRKVARQILALKLEEMQDPENCRNAFLKERKRRVKEKKMSKLKKKLNKLQEERKEPEDESVPVDIDSDFDSFLSRFQTEKKLNSQWWIHDGISFLGPLYTVFLQTHMCTRNLKCANNFAGAVCANNNMDQILVLSLLVTVAIVTNIVLVVVVIVIARHFANLAKHRAQTVHIGAQSVVSDELNCDSEFAPLLPSQVVNRPCDIGPMYSASVGGSQTAPTPSCRSLGTSITSAKDALSTQLIQIGDIITVFKPFHSSHPDEFNALQTGDLLQVEGFYVKDDSFTCGRTLRLTEGRRNKTRIMSQSLASANSDPDSEQIWCKATLLEAYLDYDAKGGSFVKKNRTDPFASDECGCCKGLPFHCITLESSLVCGDDITGLALWAELLRKVFLPLFEGFDCVIKIVIELFVFRSEPVKLVCRLVYSRTPAGG